MTQIRDTIRGAIKLNSLPERATFKTWEEFIKALPGFLSVEVPSSAISGVVVSSSAPTEDERDKLWFRRSVAGSFVGIYAFQGGAWERFYMYAPGEVVWLTGNSNNPPKGFRVIESGEPTLPAAVVNAITAQYVPISTPGAGFAYYAALFIGY